MTTKTTAVFENGTLRPLQPLALENGETVDITVSRQTPAERLSEEEIVRMIQGAKTLEEAFTILDKYPDDDDGYDLAAALNENRRLSGDARVLFPPELKGITW